MLESRFIKRRLAVASLLAVFGGVLPAASQECEPTKPYVFILFDTSGSMNYSPPCTQAQIDAGQCSFLCPTGNCYVPLQGDDPASRFFQMKEALYTSLENQLNLQLGFATYNQDTLRVQSKHWLYQAQNGGPVISSWGAYPAAGSQEVFGALWGCDTGSGDNEAGCYAASPADLPDAWELGRVRRLPKGGASFNQTQTVFLRRATTVYKATYVPTPLSTPGAPTLNVNVIIDRCSNSACTIITPVGQQTVTWSLVDEFLAWDNGSTTTLNRTNPALHYFTGAVNDAQATNLCNNWESNTDSPADPSNGYNLRWPTDTSDPRGPELYKGDVLPLDWLYDNRQDIMNRLAPNIALGALTPDFRISGYFQNLPQAGESFLRLTAEPSRPLIALGSSGLGHSIRAFHLWYQAWEPIAAANDPEWACRDKYLLVITGNPVVCAGTNPCAEVSALRSHFNLKSFVAAFGTPVPVSHPLLCIAQNGGTGSPFYPQTKQELIDTLNTIFAAVAP